MRITGITGKLKLWLTFDMSVPDPRKLGLPYAASRGRSSSSFVDLVFLRPLRGLKKTKSRPQVTQNFHG